jgi:hypothetical protein
MTGTTNEDAILDKFIEWAECHIDGDLAEELESADEATVRSVSRDRGLILIDDEPFASWLITKGDNVEFTLK